MSLLDLCARKAICNRGAYARFGACLATLLLTSSFVPAASTSPSRAYQIKAVFLYNFAQFVEWPPAAFENPKAPLVIGIVGHDPFGSYLDETVKGETVGSRPIAVARYKGPEEIGNCHILFVADSEMPKLDKVLEVVKGRSILTVGDVPGFATAGGMIRFVTLDNKIRMRINVDAAKAVGLTLSSKLLRMAEIVPSGKD